MARKGVGELTRDETAILVVAAKFLCALERLEADPPTSEELAAFTQTANVLPSIPSLMGHPMGRTPHDSWANRRRPMHQIFPEFMGHPTLVESIFVPEQYLCMENM
ncbi:hypothetical protein EDB85DRAFT_1900584 [Lactarius pseudohatsudake]|nr:hypothetical protein EDB85DRAFT_1900584 [Lactarius pseudohatsudake]